MQISNDIHYERFLDNCRHYLDEYFHQLESEGVLYETQSYLENYFLFAWELIRIRRINLEKYNLIPQLKFDENCKLTIDNGFYIVDFIICCENLNIEVDDSVDNIPSDFDIKTYRKLKIGIEIDGFEHHEKTKEQFEYEKERNRFFMKHGWKIFHFAGTEIYNNPFKCIEEVANHLIEMEHK